MTTLKAVAKAHLAKTKNGRSEANPGPKKSASSLLEETLARHIALAGLPDPVREFACIPGRKFRFDFAWPKHGLLLEVQGGTFSTGAHSTGTGISRDCEKLNLAVIAGWRVMHVTCDQIKSGMAIRHLQSYFNQGEAA